MKNNALHVLIIAMEYPPFVKGGLGVHYAELVESLGKFCKVTIICAQSENSYPSYEKKDNVTIQRITIPSLFPFNHIHFNIVSFIKSFTIDCDVIHICAPFGLLNTFYKRKPTVTKIHTLYKTQKGSFIYNNIIFPLAAFMDKIMIKRSDVILTTSEFMEKEIINIYKVPPDKVTSILNGINSNFYYKVKINPPKIKNILYVGRFVERKNALSIITAIPEIIKKYKDIKFIFIGGGFTEGNLYEQKIKRTINELKIEKYVRIIPWIEQIQLKEYYRDAYIFIHPADYEPFGNNILEAMASGTPVISSNWGGPKEIIGSNGTLLKHVDNTSIAKVIQKYLRDVKYRNKMANLALSRAKKFSWDKNAQETIKIYKKIIKK